MAVGPARNMALKRLIGRCFGLIWLFVLLTITYMYITRMTTSPITTVRSQKRSTSCIRPNLPIWSSEIRKYIRPISANKCPNDPDWVFVSNGTIHYSPEMQRKYGHFNCTAIPVIVENDKDKYLDKIAISNGSQMPSDAIIVSCSSENGRRYKNIHLGVVPRPTIPDRKRDDTLPNIVMLSFDSVSMPMLQRLMPRTHAYFTNNLGGVLLEGFNIVGDGTTAAHMSIMAGQYERKVHDMKKGNKDAKYVDDVLDFVFNHYINKGYATALFEDGAHAGAFHYRLKGFKKPPVHHYARGYNLAAGLFLKNNCIGSRSLIKTYYDWLKDLVNSYAEKKYFSFGHIDAYSHSNIMLLSTIDEETQEFLQYISDNGFLENTILFLMSDHGTRFGEFRATEQGKLEEKIPYAGVYLPKAFRDKYPDKTRMFYTNIDRLTTGFDIHKTLIDVIGEQNIQHKNTSRGVSLFQEIPETRTCADLDILPHFCACLNWKNVSVADKHVTAAVKTVEARINSKLEPYQHSCHNVKVVNVISAKVFETRIEVLQSKRLNNGGLATSDKTRPERKVIQVTFYTNPTMALYEASITYDATSDEIIFDDKAISRLNRYGSNSDCIKQEHPHVSMFCVCKTKSKN